MDAFGAPGIVPTWTSSAKDAVITGLGASRLWATFGFGIVNEVYWPSTGMPQLRDLGFIVARDTAWFEVKRVDRYQLSTPAPEIPLPRALHTGDGYTLALEFLADPERDALLVSYRLTGAGCLLYPLVAPHLGASGRDNSAWIESGALCASSAESSLCLLSESGFRRASAGFVGASDGWQDFAHNSRMTWQFDRASNGNVALMGELEESEGTLALAFADSPEGARTLAAASLAAGYDAVRECFLRGWRGWNERLTVPASGHKELEHEARLSAAVLKTHEDRTYPGAVVASLSIPWGGSNDDPGGYHLVWARDAVEVGLALLAIGDRDGAARVLSYLGATQSADGHWRQNFFPDGRPYWNGIQLDEVGLPIVLAAKLREAGIAETPRIPAMVRAAAGYLARSGPLSQQDRWEENAGASPFTVAVVVAALVASGSWLEGVEREYALALADCWNERIEDWTYLEGSELAREHGIAGYYVRIGPTPGLGGLRGLIEVKNRPGELVDASALIGLDFLYLARLGLRRNDDARLRDTLKLADALLRVETPNGAAYRRYPDDGYGEHRDGSPFDGTGIGRAWPLLAGERGHAELLAGGDPLPYLESMARLTGRGGLIPEQVWDADPIPERNLFPGRPSGSAMPLVWAHAEFLKLLTASIAGRPVELLETVEARWNQRRPEAQTWFWRDDVPFPRLPSGRALVIETHEPFTLHLGFDGWTSVDERASAPLGFTMHGVYLDALELRNHACIDFTRRYSDNRWEGHDYSIALR